MFKGALQSIFQRDQEASENSAWGRMACEIKGSIFTLVALFELVALTSYLRLDTFNVYNGIYDGISNLGGLVGALIAEWTLGNVGVMGYTVVLATAYMAIAAFRGTRFSNQFIKLVGILLGTILGAIACYLLFHDS